MLYALIMTSLLKFLIGSYQTNFAMNVGIARHTMGKEKGWVRRAVGPPLFERERGIAPQLFFHFLPCDSFFYTYH